MVETGETRVRPHRDPIDPIVMIQAFAELRYGVVVHTREHSVKDGHNLGQIFMRVKRTL